MFGLPNRVGATLAGRYSNGLPLGSDTNAVACEQAIGEYVLPEAGLFTR